MSPDLFAKVSTCLQSAQVPDQIRGSTKESDYQFWAYDVVTAGLGNGFTVKCEAAGGGVQPVKIFGTSFWPDLAVASPGKPNLLAIEVKCLSRNGLPNGISQAIGQAAIYTLLYERSLIAYILVEDIPAIEDLQTGSGELWARLNVLGIRSTVVDAFAEGLTKA